MTWTRVLVGAVMAATFVFAPSAWATTASVSGNATAATLTVTATGTTAVTVTLCNPQPSAACTPAAATAQPCDVAPCTTGTGPDPAQYVVHDPAGVTPSANCPNTAYPGAAADLTRVWCSRLGTGWGAYTVIINGAGVVDNNIRLVSPVITAATEAGTGDVSWINGGDGNDTLVGSENNDFMSGGLGNDVMEGYAGNDILTGFNFQGGVDAVGLPNGIDFINGAFSAASLSTNAGTDRIFGGGGSDIVTDGDRDDGANNATADVLSGWSCPGIGAAAGGSCPVPADTLNGDVSENDIDELYWGHRTKAVRVNTTSPSAQGGCPSTTACTSGGENEIAITFRGVYSGAGNDTLTGHSGAAGVGNTFYGGAGTDHLDGLDGNDELIGGDGPDTLLGGAGGDFLNPGGHVVTSGANTTMTSDGADTVDGGANGSDTTGDGSTVAGLNDLITYSGRSDNLTLNLNVTTGWGALGENDVVSNVEDVTGGHGADTITLRSGQASIVESDPIAPEIAHPGEPPVPTPPPGGYFADDVINARTGAADTIDCGGDALDPDFDRATVDTGDVTAANCEAVDRPQPPPVIPGGGGGGTTTGGRTGGSGSGGGGAGTVSDGRTSDPTKVRISGGNSAGRIRVKKDGSFTLTRFVISCPRGGKTCSVRTSAGNGAKAASYGIKSYSLKSNTKGAAKGKLSKKTLKRLKKRKSLKATVTIRVLHNGSTTLRKVKVTFRR